MSETPALVRMAWLQGMMSHRCVTQNQAVALHKRACQAVQVPYHPQSYSDMLQEVKDSISAVGLEIRGLVDETTGANLLALVNAKSDTLAQGATAYSSQEIIYIKRLIKAIFTAPDEAYSVSSMKALSESSFVKPHMTKRACEELLASLVRHDWVEKSRTGHYSLTTRTILELQSYLKNEFPDYVLECTQCMDIITKGFACSTPDCDGRFHIHCNKVAGSSPSRKCPKCKESWDPLPIGEGSIGSNRKPNPEEEEEEEVQPDVSTQSKKKAASSNRKASGSSSKSRRKSRNDDEEEEEEDEEMDQDDEEDQQPGPSRKTAAGSRKSGRNSSRVRVAGGYVQRNDEPGSESEEDDDE